MLLDIHLLYQSFDKIKVTIMDLRVNFRYSSLFLREIFSSNSAQWPADLLY